MKLIATKRKGKHLKKKNGASGNEQKKRRSLKLNLGAKIAIGVVLGISAIALGAMAYLKLAAAPPPIETAKHTPPVMIIDNGDEPAPTPVEPTVRPPEVRNEKKYTFLVLGTDDGNGNTDVIMLATLDTSDYSLNVVNIPRDTLVNVSWATKKVNTIYSVMKKKGTEADEMAGVKSKFADLVGYPVDFYLVVDLDAFAHLVDAVGGIYFDVPRNMKYSDPAQNLYIDIAKGPQTLNGKKALQLVRFRSGYASADIGRIEMTQQFLMAAATQILKNKDSLSITSIANIFIKYVDTNLKLNSVVWFAKELLKLDAENISFNLLPANTNDSINGDSYVTIYVNDWLTMINEKLNPFGEPITLDNLSIYTRGKDKQLYVTNGVYEGKKSWGQGSSSSNGGSKATPTPKPSETPKQTPPVTDNPGETPKVTDNPIVTDNPLPTIDPVTPVPQETPEITPPPATPPDEGGGSLFYTGTI